MSAESSDPRPATLHQRLAAITGEVKIVGTGKTDRGQRTISIGDVDEALGPLMAKHGVVSDYEFLDPPVILYEQPTRGEGLLRVFLVHLLGIATNADDQGDRIERSLFDIGTSPSAAVSFALKRWHRALFKLVEDDDQEPAAGRAQPPQPPAGRPDGSVVTAAQKRRLKELHDALPDEWKLSADDRKTLWAGGFKHAEEVLVLLGQKAIEAAQAARNEGESA